MSDVHALLPMFPIQAPHTLHILVISHMICSLCTPPTWSLFGSYARCAQDGPSFSIQAWPSHSRWYCKTCIHGILGGGAIPTHSCREPSPSAIKKIHFSWKIRWWYLTIFSRLDMIGSIFTLQLPASSSPPTETQPDTKCCICVAIGISIWGTILADHITSYGIDHHRSCHHMP